MNDANRWLIAPAAIVVSALIPTRAIATDYLSVEQAQRALFPEATSFVERPIALTEAQRRAVVAASPTRTPPPQRAWEALANDRRVGWFIVDEVYGKHEYITYAAAIEADGAIRNLEVMTYRETYGDQIRNPKWRAQFAGKRNGAALELDHDIKNISGATLSCLHITEGVKRLLALHEAALK